MLKWLLEIVFASILKRNISTSFRCALRFVRRDYTTLLEIENILHWIEDRARNWRYKSISGKDSNYDRGSD